MNIENVVNGILIQVSKIIENNLFKAKLNLSGRDGSTNAEKKLVIPLVKNNFINSTKYTPLLNKSIKGSGFKFNKFIIPTANSESSIDIEAVKRNRADIYLVLKQDTELINVPINIKSTKGNTPDNTTSWETLAYIIFGSFGIKTRGKFFDCRKPIVDIEKFNYYYWTFFKNNDSTKITGYSSHSMLQIPVRLLTFNINQPTPIQIKHHLLNKHKDEIERYTNNCINDRRIALFGWLMKRLQEQYSEYLEKIKKSKEHYDIK